MTSLYEIWDAKKERPDQAPPTSSPIVASSRYITTAVERETEAVTHAPEGTRNHTLNKAAFNLSTLIGKGLTEQDIWNQLRPAAAAAGLTPNETDRTIRSGIEAGAQQPRTITVHDTTSYPPATILDETGQPTPESVDQVAAWVNEKMPAVDWYKLWAEDDDDEWIIEPLLPARRLVALYSAPKVGKSLLMLEVAVAVSRGTEVLGSRPDRPYRVLYVDFENDPRGDIRERLRDMHIGPDDLGNLVYLTFPNLAKLDTERGGIELTTAITHYQTEVVIIDTVSRSIQGDENENDTWLDFYRETGIRLKQAGVSLIRLDHSGKDETKGQRGGSAKSGDVDAVWRMSRVTDDTYRLECEANRLPVMEKTLVLTRKGNPLRHKVESDGTSAQAAAIIRAADEAGLPRDTGRPTMTKTLRALGVRGSKRAFEEAVKTRKLSALNWGGQQEVTHLPSGTEGSAGQVSA